MIKNKFFKPSVTIAIIAVLLLIPLMGVGPYLLHVLIMAGIAVILASSLRLTYNSGLLSLGHGGFMTIGAYTSALLVINLGLSTWAALLAGALGAGLAALLLGFPFVRLKGMYFSLVTVFMAQVIVLIAQQWGGLTGGTTGIFDIPRPDPIVIGSFINIDFSSKADFYYLIVALVLFSLFIMYLIERSSITLTWHSIRQADSLAESVGINTMKFKIIAFCIGSAFAGLAGAFYSQYINVVIPTSFGFVYTVYILVYVIVGGIRSFWGPLIGAVLLTFLPESARFLKEYQPFVFTGILVLVMFLLPQGVVSLPGKLLKFAKERFSRAYNKRAN